MAEAAALPSTTSSLSTSPPPQQALQPPRLPLSASPHPFPLPLLLVFPQRIGEGRLLCPVQVFRLGEKGHRGCWRGGGGEGCYSGRDPPPVAGPEPHESASRSWATEAFVGECSCSLCGWIHTGDLATPLVPPERFTRSDSTLRRAPAWTGSGRNGGGWGGRVCQENGLRMGD